MKYFSEFKLNEEIKLEPFEAYRATSARNINKSYSARYGAMFFALTYDDAEQYLNGDIFLDQKELDMLEIDRELYNTIDQAYQAYLNNDKSIGYIHKVILTPKKIYPKVVQFTDFGEDKKITASSIRKQGCDVVKINEGIYHKSRYSFAVLDNNIINTISSKKLISNPESYLSEKNLKIHIERMIKNPHQLDLKSKISNALNKSKRTLLLFKEIPKALDLLTDIDMKKLLNLKSGQEFLYQLDNFKISVNPMNDINQRLGVGIIDKDVQLGIKQLLKKI